MACKRQAIATRTASAGPAVEIPQVEAPVTPQYVGTRHWRRRNQKFLRKRDTPERPL